MLTFGEILRRDYGQSFKQARKNLPVVVKCVFCGHSMALSENTPCDEQGRILCLACAEEEE